MESYADVDLSSVRIADLPASVQAEAHRGAVVLPNGELDVPKAKALIVKLRRSELRKQRQLVVAISAHAKQKNYLRKRGKKS